MGLRTILVCVLIGMWAGVEGRADAETARPPKRNILVLHSSLEKSAIRISAELVSLGYEVQILDAAPPITDSSLPAIAEQHEADAIMRISPEGSSVRVIVFGEKGQAQSLLQEVTVPEDAERPEALLAFMAVELLRAGFLALPEIKKPAVKNEPPRPPAPPVSKYSERPAKDNILPSPRRLALSLMPGALFSFDGFSPGFQIGGSLMIYVISRVGLEIAGLVPTFPMTASTDGGLAKVSAGMITAGFRVNLLPAEYRLTPALAVSAGPMFIRAESEPLGGLRGYTHSYITAVVVGNVSSAFRMNHIVSFKADISIGVSVREYVFAVADAPAVAFGRPLLTVLLGVVLRLF